MPFNVLIHLTITILSGRHYYYFHLQMKELRHKKSYCLGLDILEWSRARMDVQVIRSQRHNIRLCYHVIKISKKKSMQREDALILKSENSS